jgi:predicted metal-binding protein
MGKKVDWDKWRRKYIQGMELVEISEVQGAPSYSALRNRSSQHDWPDQRRRFQYNSIALAQAVTPEVEDVVRKANEIIDTAEMLTRHSKALRQIGAIAMRAFQSYDPASLKPSEATALLRLALEYERLTEGLATQRQEIDLSSLSDAELERLARG